jgi:hypothetical protein
MEVIPPSAAVAESFTATGESFTGVTVMLTTALAQRDPESQAR